MPEITGRLRTPRLAGAPASPVVGELYYDTTTNILYYWNGTTWASASQGAQGPPGPMGEIAAATFGNITATAAPGALLVDFGTIAFDGQPVTVEFCVGFINLNTDSNCSVHLHDFITGSDVLVTRMGFWRNAVLVRDGSGVWCPVTCKVRITPSAGNHRYRLRFQLDSGAAGIINQLELPNYARIVKAAAAPGVGAGQHYAGISPGRIIGPATDEISGNYTAPPAFVLYTNNAGTIPCEFLVTPTLDCWWELGLSVLVRNTVANWGRHEFGFQLTDAANTAKNDALGLNIQNCAIMHHSGGSDWVNCRGQALWALTAGQTYKCRAMVNYAQGGYNWNIYRSAANLQFYNMGARPRY
jgi:hypothetical protein